MGDYNAKHIYADQITGTASATITGGQCLYVTGDGTVGPTTAASASFVGVACHDAASAALVAYNPRGKVHRSTAASAITAGAQLVSATAGKVDDLAAASGNAAGDINSARSVIGVALTTAGSGETVEWMQIG